jgi:predicted DNA binding CopG/RHH family protein
MKRESAKSVVPAFPTEAKEVEWWYKNRKKLDKDFERAALAGEVRVLDRKTLRDRVARSKASKVVSIRLPESDIKLARVQAALKGLPYQTYIKSLLHQALEREKRAV